jgi:hypothetical protein
MDKVHKSSDSGRLNTNFETGKSLRVSSCRETRLPMNPKVPLSMGFLNLRRVPLSNLRGPMTSAVDRNLSLSIGLSDQSPLTHYNNYLRCWDRLCGLVVRVPEARVRFPALPKTFKRCNLCLTHWTLDLRTAQVLHFRS